MSGINAGQLRQHVVRPVVRYMAEATGLPMDSESGEMILIGTQATESHGHHWISQYPAGPARGGYQMEVATHDWLRDDYLERRTELRDAIAALVPQYGMQAERMTYDLAYATAMARVRYWVDPEPLPDANDILGLAATWKRVWNTAGGAGSIEKFINDFRLYAGDVL